MLYITGITGHSGRWFFERLKKEKYSGKIRCSMQQSIEACPEKYALFKDCNLDIEFAVGNLEDENFLNSFLSHPGRDSNHPNDTNDANQPHTLVHIVGIQQSEKLMEMAIAKSIDWAILVHTTGRFSKFKSASSDYIRIEDEILKKRNQIAVTVLRPTMIYGSSRDKNMYRLVNYLDKFPVFPLFGDGSNLMQPVHAKDLGNAYYDVLIRPDITKNQEYDLSGKEPVTYKHIIQIISKYLNRKVKILPVPFGLSLSAAKAYNAVLGKHAIISVEQVLRMKEDKAFSHEKATKDFGYNPYSFDEGIKGEVEEFMMGVRVDFSGVTYK